MNKAEQKGSPVRDRIITVLFYLIIVLLFPVTLVGYLFWIGYALRVGRGSGVSGTAQGPLSARWFQHQFGIRQDEPANRLLRVLPGVSPLALRLVSTPVLLAHGMTGYVPRTFRYPFTGEISIQVQAAARQTFFDRVVERYLPDMAQFVILGAGFDTRAFRLPQTMPVRAFEVDTPQTQALKRAMLEKTGIKTSGVTFVAADFEQQNWLDQLVAAGFDPSKPTLFLWEGVIIYLAREAAEDALRKIASTAKGSFVAFDYFTTEVLESNAPYMWLARMATKANDEPLKFGIDSTPPVQERLVTFLHACGLSLAEQQTLGQETNGQRAWGGFAIAIVK